jgi:hypothetical protein
MTPDELSEIIFANRECEEMNSRHFIPGDVVVGIGVVCRVEEEYWICWQISYGRVTETSFVHGTFWDIHKRLDRSVCVRQLVEVIHE